MSEQMASEVATAISEVMAGVKTLGKDDTNQHAKYDFVSTDKFLAAVNPLCAKAGLLILQEEESVDVTTTETADEYGKVKSRSWLTARYGFTLAHKSGAMHGPLHRTVMVQATGAQAFGSAQSYALKQFMRSLFQISTGDKDDADLSPHEDMPAHRGRANSNGNGARTAAPKQSEADQALRELANGILAAIKGCETQDALNTLLKVRGDDLATVKKASQNAYETLMDNVTKRDAQLAGGTVLSAA